MIFYIQSSRGQPGRVHPSGKIFHGRKYRQGTSMCYILKEHILCFENIVSERCCFGKVPLECLNEHGELDYYTENNFLQITLHQCSGSETESSGSIINGHQDLDLDP